MNQDPVAFIPGIELSRGFYRDAVAPILRDIAPELRYSAALIGPGSEVLGFDDAMSTDHHWGPRVLIFTTDDDAARRGPDLSRVLAERLPPAWRGYSTNFTEPDPSDHGTQLLRPVASGPVNHRVEFAGMRRWLDAYLGPMSFAPAQTATGTPAVALDPIDWLTLPQQKLRSLVSGEVFHDGLPADAIVPGSSRTDVGALTVLRGSLAWYPDDVWRYLIASVWQRIGQEEHLVGRAGYVGDEMGSRIIASRLVRDIMRFCFLAERRYAPYPKWLGTAFGELSCSPRITASLASVTEATDWRARDRALGEVYAQLASIHNALRITEPLPAEPHRFFGRPFTVLAIEGFAEATLGTVDAPWLTAAMRRSPIGNIDLITDNTDLLEDPAYRANVHRLIAGEPA